MKFFITAILVYKWNIEATLSAQQFRHNYTKAVKPLMKGQKKQPEGIPAAGCGKLLFLNNKCA